MELKKIEGLGGVKGMSDCKECRRLRLKYEDCAGFDWYSERDMFYCPHQVIWVLKHLGELKTGYWPEKPLTEEQERNYLPSLGKVPAMGGTYGNASFERACCVAADVESRIDKTGRDGDILRTFYCQGYTDITELASKMGEPIAEIERSIKNSLQYVRGWREKKTPYNKWLADRHYYKWVTKKLNSSKKLDNPTR